MYQQLGKYQLPVTTHQSYLTSLSSHLVAQAGTRVVNTTANLAAGYITSRGYGPPGLTPGAGAVLLLAHNEVNKRVCRLPGWHLIIIPSPTVPLWPESVDLNRYITSCKASALSVHQALSRRCQLVDIVCLTFAAELDSLRTLVLNPFFREYLCHFSLSYLCGDQGPNIPISSTYIFWYISRLRYCQ